MTCGFANDKYQDYFKDSNKIKCAKKICLGALPRISKAGRNGFTFKNVGGDTDTNTTGQNKNGKVGLNADGTNKYTNKANLDDLNQKYDNCSQIIDMNEGHFGWLLQKLLNYIKIAGPILVVLLSALDFIKESYCLQ